jgi:hypothetical protein
MESLTSWAKDHPEEKVLGASPMSNRAYHIHMQTLIISQWTQCLGLVSDYLTENGFLHVKWVFLVSAPVPPPAHAIFAPDTKET